MLAWQKHLGNLEAVQQKVPIPACPENGFLVKILAAGVCHSDYALLQLEARPFGNWAEKYTLGHEGCGEIVEIGSKVDDVRFQRGTIIAILSVPGCGEKSCLQCGSELPQLCKNALCLGIGGDGSFAPYVAVPYRGAVPVPEGVTPPQAAVATDACLTAYHAVKRTAKVEKSETVLIFGLGGLGFNALQIVMAIGSRVLVVEKRQAVLDEAVNFGLPKEDVIPPGEDVVAFVAKNKIVVDVVIDFVGVKETFSASQHLLRPGGRACQVGLLGADLTLHNNLAVRKKLTILCSYGGIYEDVVDCLDLIAQGKLRPQVETGALNDFPSVLERLHEGKIKSRIALIPGEYPSLST